MLWKQTLFYVVLVSLPVAGIVVSDYAVGLVNETALIRADAKRFRTEAAPLQFPTQNLVPNTRHSYPEPHRPEGDRLVPSNASRVLQTDAIGTISPPDGVNHQALASRTVLFLGGSTTECNEVDEPFRFPARVELLLSSSDMAIRTINGGVRGHTTIDSINSLLNRSAFRSADIVVLMHNINDRLRLALQGNYDARLGSAAPGSMELVKASASDLVTSLWDYATYNSNALFLLNGYLLSRSNSHSISVSERTIDFGLPAASEQLNQYKQNLEAFIALTRALGKLPILMTQPLARRSPAQDLFNDAIREVAAKQSAELIDLELEITGLRDSLFLSDDIHLSNFGSLHVASVIAGRLARTLNIPVRSDPIKLAETESTDLSTFCAKDGVTFDRSSANPKKFLSNARYPSFSPDGSLLLFQSINRGLSQINALEMRTGRFIRLTPDSSNGAERHPTFFGGDSSSFSVLFGAGTDPDGRGHELLKVREWPSMKSTSLPIGNLAGSIPARHSGETYFAGTQNSLPPNLYKLDSEGKIKQLSSSTREQWRPAVSPDGTVYFISDPQGSFDIFKLPKGATVPTLVYGSPSDEWDPAISSDGTRMAFASKQSGKWSLYLLAMNQPSGVPDKLSDSKANQWDPAFHPNLPILAYATSNGHSDEVWLMCLPN